MKKQIAIMTVILAFAMMSSLYAAVFDYTAGGMNGADWTIQTYTPTWGTWSDHFSTTQAATTVSFTALDTYGSGGFRGAAVWSAPVGQYISQITFNWGTNTDPSVWDARAFNVGSTGTLNNLTTPLWTAPGTAGFNGGPQTLSYSSIDNVTKIGLGVETFAYAFGGWSANYSAVVITTIPEPASLGLLALGGLALLRRRR